MMARDDAEAHMQGRGAHHSGPVAARHGATVAAAAQVRPWPRLRLEDYFGRRVRASGLVTDRFGTVRRQFVVDLRGTWQPDVGILTLDESFSFSDGGTDRRIWTLTRTPGDRWTGRADDVVGEARGRVDGNAFRWTYRLALPVGRHTVPVFFDDRMYLQPDGSLLGRARMAKWGVTLGTVAIAFRPARDDA